MLTAIGSGIIATFWWEQVPGLGQLPNLGWSWPCSSDAGDGTLASSVPKVTSFNFKYHTNR